MAKKKRKPDVEEFSHKSHIEDMIADLERAAELEGAEMGEYWTMLGSEYGAVQNAASDWFANAWCAEIQAQHRRLREEFVIVHGERYDALAMKVDL